MQVPSVQPKADPTHFRIVVCQPSSQSGFMAQDTRATIIGGGGLLEVAAVALAGLTLLAVVARLDTNARSCLSAPILTAERRMGPVAPEGIEDAALRGMLLRD